MGKESPADKKKSRHREVWAEESILGFKWKLNTKSKVAGK